MTPGERAAQILGLLEPLRAIVNAEFDVQDAIGAALTDAGIAHQREARLDGHSRIDFLTADGVGIEVKRTGSAVDVTRQLLRYAHHPDIHALVLATTVVRHHEVPEDLDGVPVRTVFMLGGAW